MAKHVGVAKFKNPGTPRTQTGIHPTQQGSTDASGDHHRIQNTQGRLLQIRPNLERDKFSERHDLKENMNLRLPKQQHKHVMTSQLPM